MVAAIAEGLDFQATFLATYASKVQHNPRYRVEHLRMLRNSESPYGPKGQSESYGGFIGQAWAPPIHLGLLALADSDESWLHRLREWQERWSYISMIGPHFGLSPDYDEFVLGQAPVLWTFTAALMYKSPTAGTYVTAQLAAVLDKIVGAKPKFSFFTAIWALHAASAVRDEVTYMAVEDDAVEIRRRFLAAAPFRRKGQYTLELLLDSHQTPAAEEAASVLFAVAQQLLKRKE